MQKQGRIQVFFRRGCPRLLLYFNTNKSHSFFLQNTSCIRKPQVTSGGGGAHPLHPPPRSAPVFTCELLLMSSINAIELLTERGDVIKLLLSLQINCLHYPSPPNLFLLSNHQTFKRDT